MGAKRILAVDDSALALEALGEALRGEGFEVLCATSGEEALTLLAMQPVDCILLDLLMPGLGGEATCRQIKAISTLRDIPLLVVTGNEDRAAMVRALGAGADDYIAKSTDLDVLKARVRAQLRRRQFEEESQRIRDQLRQRELEAAEARAARELAETRAALVDELERKNQELEAFSYSVSHDLRAPLRGILGFSEVLLAEHQGGLDARGQDYLQRVAAAARRMDELIDALLSLSGLARRELSRSPVNLTEMAREVAAELQASSPSRPVEWVVAPDLVAEADPRLLRAVVENLLGNAWKFSARVAKPRIEVGAGPEHSFFVRDDGAGFSMRHAARLFRPFQRLHASDDFAGTGIGLATVQRIIERHGGRVWAEGAVGEGATFRFTLPPAKGGRG